LSNRDTKKAEHPLLIEENEWKLCKHFVSQIRALEERRARILYNFNLTYKNLYDIIGYEELKEYKVMNNGSHGLVPHRNQGDFPYSRDWIYDDQPCSMTSCLFNSMGGHCVVPSKCIIGEDGKCTGYVAKPISKEKTGD